MNPKPYTIKQLRCKLVADGASLQAPIECVNDRARAEHLARWYFKRLAIPHERLIAILLGAKCNVMGIVRVSEGGLAGTACTQADIFRPVVAAGARAVILAHNHPSGDPTPSADDISMTVAAGAAGKVLGIPLVDHIVVGSNGGWLTGSVMDHLPLPGEVTS